MKVGYIALAKASWMTPKIDTIVSDTIRELKKLENVELVAADKPQINEQEASRTAEYFAAEQVDLVIMHFATFPAGALIPAVAQRIDAPFILLANPESATPDGMWEQNSFCGANLGAFVMKRLGKKYAFIRALPAEVNQMLATPLAAVRAVRDLKDLRIGLVGGRVPGFYTSNFDEMKLRRNFGVTVEILDLLELTHSAGLLTDDALNRAAKTVSSAAAGVCRVPESELALAARMLGAFDALAEKYRLNTFAVRCWPECSDIFGIAPCAVLGMLSDSGRPTSCEGDIPGAVTMNLLRSLAGGGIPIFVDLISYERDKNTGVIWHCGAAPVSLCRKFSETSLRLHMRVDGGDKKGLTNDFSLKSGDITIAKLDQDENGRFRMLIIHGEALDTPPFMRGNPLEIRFDSPVETVIDVIMKRGFEHHYAAIHADVTGELRQFCEWNGIEIVQP